MSAQQELWSEHEIWHVDPACPHPDIVYEVSNTHDIPVIYSRDVFGHWDVIRGDGLRIIDSTRLYLCVWYQERFYRFAHDEEGTPCMRMEVTVFKGEKMLERWKGPRCHPEETLKRAHKRALYHTESWVKRALALDV